MKEKILITGATGLVGSHFVENNTEYQLFTPSSQELDLQNLSALQVYIDKNTPGWIINFAAYTDVNAAENQKGDENAAAWQVNVQGVSNLLAAFKSKNFIQISTDMVFPGNLSQPGPYAEDDVPPETSENLTWYGWTKNRAEALVLERGASILRIIYPVRAKFAGKPDYIRGPLQKYANDNLHPLFNDQQISVSFIPEVTETLKLIINTDSHGIFHASSDTTTPYELITRVISELGEDPSTVKSSSVVEFLKTQNNPARYPVYGGLKTKLTEDALETHFSTWQTVVEYLVAGGLKIPDKQ